MFFKLIKYRIPIPLPNNGNQKIQFVDVEDLARLILHIGFNKINGEWPAAAPNPKPLKDHLQTLGANINKKVFRLNINPKLFELAKNNDIEAYNIPQGVIARLYSSIGSKAPGLITKTGLGTYIDPRFEGGKLNSITKDDLIEVVQILEEEYLLYKSLKKFS